MSVYSLLGAPQLGQMYSRLIFALDVATVPEAVELVKLLRSEVGMFQVGKQLFLHAGPEVVREIKQHGGEVFLDLKFHDIPRTVAKAGAEATRLAVRMFDVHASGSVNAGGEPEVFVTTTENVPVAVPKAFVAEQVTVVVPTGNSAPDA
jgi:orotidine-5'-phosphate decarboxylase